MAAAIDLTGQQFHGWTAVRRVPSSARYNRTYCWWLCRCECGRTEVLRGIDLRSGVARACHNADDIEPPRTAVCSERLWGEYPCLARRAGHLAHFYDIRTSIAKVAP